LSTTLIWEIDFDSEIGSSDFRLVRKQRSGLARVVIPPSIRIDNDMLAMNWMIGWGLKLFL